MIVGNMRILAMAAVGLFVLGASSPSRAGVLKPQVVCLTEWGYQPKGWYRTRPHKCDLHEHGRYPVAHVNTFTTKRLRWLQWSSRSAVAKGKLGISTYGLAPMKLRLLRPRQLCGHMVFTRAHLAVRVRYDGKIRRSSFWIWLDECLR